MRAFFDTNIFISYLLTAPGQGTITQIVEAAFGQTFTLLISPELLEELRRRVATKKYLAQRISTNDVQRLIDLLLEIAETIPPLTEEIPAVTRDPKDDYLLAYALVSQADYLVTGDDDLLVLGKVSELIISNPQDFLALIVAKR